MFYIQYIYMAVNIFSLTQLIQHKSYQTELNTAVNLLNLRSTVKYLQP